jgi:hypothetical protein
MKSTRDPGSPLLPPPAGWQPGPAAPARATTTKPASWSSHDGKDTLRFEGNSPCGHGHASLYFN